MSKIDIYIKRYIETVRTENDKMEFDVKEDMALFQFYMLHGLDTDADYLMGYGNPAIDEEGTKR